MFAESDDNPLVVPSRIIGKLRMTRDGFGREINYLRISLTDRCNLRCHYCMPVDGLEFFPDERLLSATEIETVVRAAASLGFRKIRLTGGEPLLRRDVVDIVRRISAVEGIEDVAMTTNGARLPSLAEDLKTAGLRRVNLHIDSLKPANTERLMRWSKHEELWAGIEAAEKAGLLPIKINTVVARGFNEDDVVEMARLTMERDWTIRFIELMPLGAGKEANFAIDRYVPNTEVKARIEAELGPLTAIPNRDPSDEARNFALEGATGRVGFISPVSEPYCASCNRMRLTADGRFHLCLLHDDQIDLREILREGGDEHAIRDALQRAVAAKPTGHALGEGVHTETLRMHAIGG